MLFSIIVPVFNASKYLKRCLESVLCQKFEDYEIVLIDDGSTDESPKICDEYSEKYPFVRVIHKENGGTVSARRTGVIESKGDYLLSVDADDYIDGDFLPTIFDELNKNGFPSVLAWSFKTVDETTRSSTKIFNQNGILGNHVKEQIKVLKKTFLYDKNSPNLNYGRLLYSFWTKAIKRELLLDAFMSFKDDINYGEDLICVKRILDNPKCNSVTVIDYYGYNYVTNESSLINSSYSLKKIESYEKTIFELENAFINEKEKVYIFSMRALIGLLRLMSKASSCYKEFLKKVKESYGCKIIWDYARKAKISSGRNDKIKIFLIKMHWFRLLYKKFK